jgi:DNA-binding transcriptional LysR family regulator
MIDIKRLRHLLAVATHSTVQAAADSLHITQSALTKSIARFEDELEAPLFDRKGHRLSLTELGKHMVKRAEELMRQVHTLEEEVSLWKGLGTGEINIGVDPVAEFGLLPEVLETFVPAHPGILISLRSGHSETLLPALLCGELHFMLADSEIARDNENLDIRELVTSPLAAAIRPDHPLSKYKKKIPTPKEVSLYPRIGAATAPRFERWQTERIRREGAEPVSRSLVSDNYGMLVGLAEKIDAIVFGPLNLLKSYEREGRLRVVPWPLEGPDTQISLILMKERHLPPAAERLIELVIKSVRT